MDASIYKIYNISGLKFLIADPNDHVQSRLIRGGEIYEEKILRDLNQYIPANPVIIDAGAHVGTHSLFWAKYANAKSIYSFEPLPQIFKVLTKNIELNGYEDIIHPQNMGLSSKPGKGSIKATVPNITALTQIKQDEGGDITLGSIDTFDFNGEKIDFIKIDTERHEQLILQGAENLIKRDKPVMFIETSYDTDQEVIDIMTSYNYKEIKMYHDEYCPWFYNRLFVYAE